jgi:hypothetical protein
MLSTVFTHLEGAFKYFFLQKKNVIHYHAAMTTDILNPSYHHLVAHTTDKKRSTQTGHCLTKASDF